jgi:hypothetical protein
MSTLRKVILDLKLADMIRTLEASPEAMTAAGRREQPYYRNLCTLTRAF